MDAAIEVADLLEASTSSVNSALQRARATLDERRASGRLGLARTPPADDAERYVYRAYGIMVLALDGDAIGEITGFGDPTVFPLLGLPGELEA